MLEPIGSEGGIAKFLETRGGGLHHISLQVDDIDKEIEQLKAKGVKLLGDKPAQPSEDSRVIFIHPSSVGGILIELMERS